MPEVVHAVKQQISGFRQTGNVFLSETKITLAEAHASVQYEAIRGNIVHIASEQEYRALSKTNRDVCRKLVESWALTKVHGIDGPVGVDFYGHDTGLMYSGKNPNWRAWTVLVPAQPDSIKKQIRVD